MDLHRAGSAPDWEQKADDDWNYWQRAAAASGGILTPGNFLTGLGLVITIWGLVLLGEDHFVTGTIALAVGRFCDIADGWAAGTTGTKNPFGETLDALVDKLATFLTLIVFFVLSIAPRSAIILLVLPQLAGAVAVLYHRRRKTRLHPAVAGKLGMAFAWFSLIGFTLSHGVGNTASEALYVSAWVLAGISVSLSGYAALGYISGEVK
jgi:phosphatidylglycerophosphate synthase